MTLSGPNTRKFHVSCVFIACMLYKVLGVHLRVKKSQLSENINRGLTDPVLLHSERNAYEERTWNNSMDKTAEN